MDAFRLQVIQRSPERLHLMFRDEPDVTQYRFFASRSLNGAYAYRAAGGVNGVPFSGGAFQLTGTVNCPYANDVNRGTTFIASSIKKKGLGQMASSWRGQTHAILNLTDPPVTFAAGNNPNACPAEDEMLYLRVEKFRVSQGQFIQDPRIYVIPAWGFYSMSSIGLALTGVAPDLSAAPPVPVAGMPLPTHDDSSMWISLPRYAQTITIQNDEAANGASLLMSWDKGMGAMPIDGDDQFNMTSTNFKDVILGCNTNNNNPQFSLLVSINNTDG
jgi:hypothetical protein